ncbi:trypco2 family protein [Actinoplanes sp. NPDC024001]|uniref:trypco2 family protein n=1 Tax=Actinoplanes sp. NPDC024001 TaxID=3154598 RepID=UPI0033E6C159
MEPEYLPLAQAIGELRNELMAAVDNATTEDLQFAVEFIELEMQVVATNTLKGEAGGTLFGVLTLKGGADHANAATHKVKLVLRPESPSAPGQDVLVADTTPVRPR